MTSVTSQLGNILYIFKIHNLLAQLLFVAVIIPQTHTKIKAGITSKISLYSLPRGRTERRLATKCDDALSESACGTFVAKAARDLESRAGVGWQIFFTCTLLRTQSLCFRRPTLYSISLILALHVLHFVPWRSPLARLRTFATSLLG